MPRSLQNQLISNTYSSILHLSSNNLKSPVNTLNGIFDGVGNETGISLSGSRVVINNYVQPEGPTAPSEWLDAFFPVNSIKLTFDDTNPGTKIANTTWELVSQGRFLVGAGPGTDKNGLVKTFEAGTQEGEYEHTLTTSEIPKHSHDIDEKVVGGDNPSAAAGKGGELIGGRQQQGGVKYTTLTTGDGESHNNIPPGYGIYVWRRTA